MPDAVRGAGSPAAAIGLDAAQDTGAPVAKLGLQDADTPAAVLERLAARGAQRADPVRWHLATALARRAPAHAGAARRVIDARLAELVDALGEVLPQAGATRAGDASAGAARPGPLAALVAHARTRAGAAFGGPGSLAPPVMSSTAPAAPRARGAARPAPAPATPVGPPALQYFRRTWSRLNADVRLAQSRATLPANTGPLNSHRLVHRALATLHELAPGYLERLIAHVDDLLWIEAATGAAGPESGTPARADGERKATRSR